jgi:hypothetical protein
MDKRKAAVGMLLIGKPLLKMLARQGCVALSGSNVPNSSLKMRKNEHDWFFR